MKLSQLYLRTVCAIIGCSCAIAAAAQPVVPGFRGKHFSVQASYSVIPNIISAHPTLENDGLSASRYSGYPANLNYGDSYLQLPTTLGLSWRAGLCAKYITGRKTALLAGYEYYPTGMLMTARSAGTANNSEMVNHYLFMGLYTHNITVGAEFTQGQGMLSPIGAYSRLTLQYTMTTAQILDKRSEATAYAPLGMDNLAASNIAIGFELGENIPIGRVAMFNYGIRSNLPIDFLTKASETTTSVNGVEYIEGTNAEVWAIMANKRLRFHSILMLNVGVSYFLF
jgi:hypothetical protein